MPGEEEQPLRTEAVTPRKRSAPPWTRLVLVAACVLGVIAAGGAVVLFGRASSPGGLADPAAAAGPNSTTAPGTGTSSTTPPGSASASPTAKPTRSPTAKPPSGPQSCPAYPKFPDANCTGVPAGMKLTNYSGPCTIKKNKTVIDRKVISCALRIQATGVMIKNSRVNGSVNASGSFSFTIMDSEVHAPQAGSVESQGVGEANFTMLRVEVTGGNRSVYCRKKCRVEDSWVHGQNIAQSPRIHASGIRQSQGAKIIHNRIHCSARDTPSGGGCSANLTGYGDFEPVVNNLIEKNLFVATPAGACAYGGSSGDDGVKPYGDQASGIEFIDNVFERGSGGKCGYYFPITDFDSSRPGNRWVNNRWDNGGVVPPAN
jgi:hypothetical protein